MVCIHRAPCARTPQVSVAALLDNFISSSSQIEIEAKLQEADLCVRDRLERNPMEPLLIKLAREFTDSQDLSDRLLKIYKVRGGNISATGLALEISVSVGPA
jgi:hypothetical protein